MESEERVSNLDTAEHVEAAQPEAPADPTSEPAAQASDDNDMMQTAASDPHTVGEDAGEVEGAGDATSEHEDMAHAVFGALGEVARKFGTTIEHLTHLVGKQQVTQSDEVTTTEPAIGEVATGAQPEPAIAMAETAQMAAAEDSGEATAAPGVDLQEPVMAMEEVTDVVTLVAAPPDLDAQPVAAQPAEPAEAEMPILAATETSQAEPGLPAEAASPVAVAETSTLVEASAQETAAAADAAPIDAAPEPGLAEVDATPTAEVETTGEVTETLVELAAETHPVAAMAETEPMAMAGEEPTMAAAEAPDESAEAVVLATAETPVVADEE